MAQAVIKLTENAERNERQEQVLDALRNTMQKIRGELGRNREETPQAKKEQGTSSIRPKLQGRVGT